MCDTRAAQLRPQRDVVRSRTVLASDRDRVGNSHSAINHLDQRTFKSRAVTAPAHNRALSSSVITFASCGAADGGDAAGSQSTLAAASDLLAAGLNWPDNTQPAPSLWTSDGAMDSDTEIKAALREVTVTPAELTVPGCTAPERHGRVARRSRSNRSFAGTATSSPRVTISDGVLRHCGSQGSVTELVSEPNARTASYQHRCSLLLLQVETNRR